MHHRKYPRPEKDISCNKDCSEKLRKRRNFSNERDLPNLDTHQSKWVEDKPRRKLSSSNLVHKPRNKSTVLIKENEEHTRTLDLVFNFEWNKKKSNSYVSAYFTDSDLNKRKMFHESNSSKNVNNLNVELVEDKVKNNKCRSKNKNYSLNITKDKQGKKEVDNGKKELEELFKATNTDFKSYCQENDIFKDLDRYFKTTMHRSKRKGCFYRLNNDAAYERATTQTPEKKCSSINLLLQKQDNYKKNKYKNGIINTDKNKNFNFNNNSIDNSSSTQNKNLNENNIIQSRTKKNKSKHTLVDVRGRVGIKDCYRNDEIISVTSEKDSLGSSKTMFSANSNHSPEYASLNSYCGELQHAYYDNYIHQNPEKLENDKKKSNKNNTSNYTTYPNEDADKYIENSSTSSILDYSISKRKQDSISRSFTGESSELPSDCTIVDYNLDRKMSKTYKSFRKPSCEIFMNRIKNKKSEKIFDYKHFIKDKASKKCVTNKKSKQYHSNFEETCRNYINNRKLRKYKVRNTRTESEFFPTSEKYSFIASKVNRPNSIEKDILLKRIDDAGSNSSRIYNYHMPFNLKMIESHKFEFNEDNLNMSQILNIDESILKSKSNDVSLKLSIPNMYVIKETNNAYSLKQSRGNEKSNRFNNSDFDISHPPRKKVNNEKKKKINLNFVEDFQRFNSFDEYKNMDENYKINKSFKNPDFLKPDAEIVIKDQEIRNSHQKKGMQMYNEVNDKYLNDTVLIYKPLDKNYGKNQTCYNKNIEVIFPIKPNRRFSYSHTTLTTLTNKSMTSSDSSKLRFCKSDLSQVLEKANTPTNKSSKKRVFIDENRNCSITECGNDEFPIKDSLTDNSLSNDTSQNKNEIPKFCEQVVSKCNDLLNSSTFKLEIEKIVNKYLEKKVIINWLGHKKFNILVFADDKVLKNNPQKIIETLQNKHMQGLMRKIKSCSYKLHKFRASCKSITKNEQTQENESFAEVEAGNCSKQNDSVPYKLVLCENCLECKNLLNASKIKSLPIFNLSKLKIQKRSVTYYSKISSHSMKIKKYKPKHVKKAEKNKIESNNNKRSKNNNNQKNNSKSKEANNGKVIHTPQGSRLFKELNEFKDLLTEVEKKQDSILSFLNLDPCGLLFTFPSSSSMIRKCNQIKRFKMPFRRLSDKILRTK